MTADTHGAPPEGRMSPMWPAAAYCAADALVRVMPAAWADAAARRTADLMFAIRTRERRVLEDNLERLLRPRADRALLRRLARDSFHHFAEAFVDFLRLARTTGDPLHGSVEVEGGEHLSAARRSGRGVIVLSAHAGHWERGLAYLAASGVRLHVAARAHRHPWVEDFFATRRKRWGILPLGRPLWFTAAQALRRGEWVALMGDRPAPGLRRSLCAWAAALARRTGAVVLLGVMSRLPDGRHLASFERPLPPGAWSPGAYARGLMRHLARQPAHWYAFEALPEGLS